MYDDIDELERAGYEVVELTPWHYQVTHNGVTCNIWPSKNKYMQEFGQGASIYDDVVAAVSSVVGPPGEPETPAERKARLKAQWAKEYPVPLDPVAEKIWRYELDITLAYLWRLIDKKRKHREAMDF